MPPAGSKATQPAYQPPPEEYIPGSTYVPPEYAVQPPPPVPSTLYGGPSGVEPTGYNDPNIIVTYYPSTGAEPTAQMTDYPWTSLGRTPPSNYNKDFPAAALLPPELPTGNPPPSPDQFFPGPPRNFVPGSTYIPTQPIPDPRKPFDERVGEARGPINPTKVPGGPLYRKPMEQQNAPYVQPGLGGTGGEGPLSPEGRPLAGRDPNIWIVGDLREPQLPQPGSSYVPRYAGIPPLGDPEGQFRPAVPSERYGGPQLRENERPTNKTRVDTLHPASGGPETSRSTGYLPDNATVMNHPEAVNRERVYDPDKPGRRTNPNAGDEPLAIVLAQMAEAEKRRRLGLRGLFGGKR